VTGIDRRGFLGRLLGLGVVGAIDPSSILGLEGAYADTYVRTPPVEVADFSQVAAGLGETYTAKDFFEPCLRDFTPFLEGLRELRDDEMVAGTFDGEWVSACLDEEDDGYRWTELFGESEGVAPPAESAVSSPVAEGDRSGNDRERPETLPILD